MFHRIGHPGASRRIQKGLHFVPAPLSTLRIQGQKQPLRITPWVFSPGKVQHFPRKSVAIEPSCEFESLGACGIPILILESFDHPVPA